MRFGVEVSDAMDFCDRVVDLLFSLLFRYNLQTRHRDSCYYLENLRCQLTHPLQYE